MFLGFLHAVYQYTFMQFLAYYQFHNPHVPKFTFFAFWLFAFYYVHMSDLMFCYLD